MESYRVFSAPSKAMVAGGYLVLDPQYRSFVTALSCRMHAKIQELELGSEKTSRICVSSPQFGGCWKFLVDDTLAIQETTGSRNPFLEATIKAVYGYVRPLAASSFQITLFSDPGYHTQDDTTVKTSSNQQRRFLYHEKPIEQVPKTGMGLSAGFVTVVTASLLTALLNKPVTDIRDVIHKVAQIAHCDAQGKIGSGFDVATAVYGSIVYRRFKPEVINHLLGREVNEEYSSALKQVVDMDWDFTSSPCTLPPGIKLLMGDVKSGSETPKLVSKVLAWRKEDVESACVYKQLDDANESFMRELDALCSLYKSDPTKYLSLADVHKYEPLKNAIVAIRRGLQALTVKSGAEVEPQEQSRLLDNCSKLPGCLGGVVPGAGGYDAICIFVLEKDLQLLREASASNPEFREVTWLDLTEESEGLIEEDAKEYEGL
ncbi:hypothetical protein PUMCH_001334 [Australozyma saopauloensis]|uniref:Phosphomevalonate kinase n=1 Tax=Australozyma saopauloensis TaxID=291208 RepID=A0AAX4H6J6_9ASCO|nr:hypothetical protein PUMCH_001334 [[Candida] saopauloensis]